jgi:hypothetical protein
MATVREGGKEDKNMREHLQISFGYYVKGLKCFKEGIDCHQDEKCKE